MKYNKIGSSAEELIKNSNYAVTKSVKDHNYYIEDLKTRIEDVYGINEILYISNEKVTDVTVIYKTDQQMYYDNTKCLAFILNSKIKTGVTVTICLADTTALNTEIYLYKSSIKKTINHNKSRRYMYRAEFEDDLVQDLLSNCDLIFEHLEMIKTINEDSTETFVNKIKSMNYLKLLTKQEELKLYKDLVTSSKDKVNILSFIYHKRLYKTISIDNLRDEHEHLCHGYKKADLDYEKKLDIIEKELDEFIEKSKKDFIDL